MNSGHIRKSEKRLEHRKKANNYLQNLESENIKLIWQDWVLAIGSWLFIVSFIPSFQKKQYPAIGTSLLTGTVLVAFAIVYYSFGLTVATISTSITAICWFALAILKWKGTK